MPPNQNFQIPEEMYLRAAGRAAVENEMGIAAINALKGQIQQLAQENHKLKEELDAIKADSNPKKKHQEHVEKPDKASPEHCSKKD